ncbi:hypothetical protein D5086_012829 [Populus alba]|uniref:Uncharacterized protein n=1 Tax=Populus alba TaxID=43335 RepID=A0ACC4C548_POPAL
MEILPDSSCRDFERLSLISEGRTLPKIKSQGTTLKLLGYSKVELEIDSAVLAAGLASKNDAFMADTRPHVRASISHFLRLRDSNSTHFLREQSELRRSAEIAGVGCSFVDGDRLMLAIHGDNNEGMMSLWLSVGGDGIDFNLGAGDRISQ